MFDIISTNERGNMNMKTSVCSPQHQTPQPTNQVCILPLKKINILNSNVAQTENKKIKNVWHNLPCTKTDKLSFYSSSIKWAFQMLHQL